MSRKQHGDHRAHSMDTTAAQHTTHGKDHTKPTAREQCSATDSQYPHYALSTRSATRRSHYTQHATPHRAHATQKAHNAEQGLIPASLESSPTLPHPSPSPACDEVHSKTLPHAAPPAAADAQPAPRPAVARRPSPQPAVAQQRPMYTHTRHRMRGGMNDRNQRADGLVRAQGAQDPRGRGY